MSTGDALEIVWAMAKRLYTGYGEVCPPANNADTVEALDTVEDFISNNFEDDGDHLVPVE